MGGGGGRDDVTKEIKHDLLRREQVPEREHIYKGRRREHINRRR